MLPAPALGLVPWIRPAEYPMCQETLFGQMLRSVRSFFENDDNEDEESQQGLCASTRAEEEE